MVVVVVEVLQQGRCSVVAQQLFVGHYPKHEPDIKIIV